MKKYKLHVPEYEIDEKFIKYHIRILSFLIRDAGVGYLSEYTPLASQAIASLHRELVILKCLKIMKLAIVFGAFLSFIKGFKIKGINLIK